MDIYLFKDCRDSNIKNQKLFDLDLPEEFINRFEIAVNDLEKAIESKNKLSFTMEKDNIKLQFNSRILKPETISFMFDLMNCKYKGISLSKFATFNFLIFGNDSIRPHWVECELGSINTEITPDTVKTSYTFRYINQEYLLKIGRTHFNF